MPHSEIATRTRRHAQSLRRSPTDAERKLWRVLRSMKPLGFHFRRQAPIGPYIADFAWYTGKLVVELDGGQHAEARLSYDQQRTTWLRSQAFEVLRFWNNDVLQSTDVVADAILSAAAKTRAVGKDPTPAPSPQGGGEKKRDVAKVEHKRARSLP